MFLGIGIATLYGLISSLAGVIQLKVKKIPLFLALGMSLIGIVITVTPYLPMDESTVMAFLIGSLLMMHFLTLANGFYLNGRINIKHHIIRLFISISIILLIL